MLPQWQCSEAQKGSGGIDLPIVMQTMFIIQLQIVPDKVLLGNRDTFTDSQTEDGRENDQSWQGPVHISKDKVHETDMQTRWEHF